MTHCDSLTSISDDELFATVQHLTARSNVALADLLAHLGEVERRGVHRLRACASLYTYCIYELRDDARWRRCLQPVEEQMGEHERGQVVYREGRFETVFRRRAGHVDGAGVVHEHVYL